MVQLVVFIYFIYFHFHQTCMEQIYNYNFRLKHDGIGTEGYGIAMNCPIILKCNEKLK